MQQQKKKDVFGWMKQADDWLIRRKLQIPTPEEASWLTDDLKWVVKMLPWMARAAVGLIFIGILVWIFYWLFWIGPNSVLSNPALQNEVPSVQSGAQPRNNSNYWTDHKWLSQSDARDLRTTENAVNLAFLGDNGSAKYSSQSVGFDPKAKVWTKFTRGAYAGLEAVSVDGTAMKVQANSQIYNLNAYQPFVFEQRPETLFLVDSTGQIWMAKLQEVKLESVEQIKQNLPVKINSNPELSLTF